MSRIDANAPRDKVAIFLSDRNGVEIVFPDGLQLEFFADGVEFLQPTGEEGVVSWKDDVGLWEIVKQLRKERDELQHTGDVKADPEEA